MSKVIYVLTSLRELIVSSYHDTRIGGGHFGQTRTYDKIAGTYILPGMSTEIGRLCKHVTPAKTVWYIRNIVDTFDLYRCYQGSGRLWLWI